MVYQASGAGQGTHTSQTQTFTMSSTPSDYRAFANMRAQLARHQEEWEDALESETESRDDSHEGDVETVNT